MKKQLLLVALLLPSILLTAQSEEQLKTDIASLKKQLSNIRHNFDALEKSVDDLLWFQRIGDVAHIDKVEITGPPLTEAQIKHFSSGGNNPTVLAKNPLRFKTYIFIPRSVDSSKKYPLMVFPHGGVHGDFNTYYTHIMRELMAQEYIVVAPEYRGSTGYGKNFYESIDYGGLEVQDVKASRDYMVENFDIVDADRVGIFGWSHGGMITLLNLFDYPEAYKVGYAGVPVSDIVSRMGYKTDRYRDLYSADYHIGKTAHQDVEEYRRRSPAWQAHKLQTPLLIHTNTIDPDVNVLEVEHLIQALKAEGKDFEYKIFQDAEGGHAFNRIDTKLAKKVRFDVYKFLARYLKPGRPFKSVKDLQKAAYGY
ncbi:MAG: alpha/beta hydrolase family protein [Saprospiraceae bacterium]